MMLVIGNLLDPHEVEALRELAGDISFEDGRRTAGRYARDVKSNLQAQQSSARDAILAKVQAALEGNAVFRAAARPRSFARLLLSRYEQGMEYGLHVDDPIIQGRRTDLSFTLFLSDPATYEGGGLLIDDPIEQRSIRLNAGDVVVYPSNTLHSVEPVTAGERLAVVGWVTSWVRDPARREILYDLDVAAQETFNALGKTPTFDRLLKSKSNLYRMWAEG